MKWISIEDELPDQYEDVLVWVKFDFTDDYQWTESCLDDQEKMRSKFSYKEPNTKMYWMMGSSKDYLITHWMRIDDPK